MVQHTMELKLCLITSQDESPLVVVRSIVVKADYSWLIHVNNHRVDPQNVSLLKDVPPLLDITSITNLLQAVHTLKTCAGNPDSKFTELARSKKGQFLSADKKVVAYLDSGFRVVVDGQDHASTVRCSDCHLLTQYTRCVPCDVYRGTLKSMHYRFQKSCKTNIQKTGTNYRYVHHIIVS